MLIRLFQLFTFILDLNQMLAAIALPWAIVAMAFGLHRIAKALETKGE